MANFQLVILPLLISITFLLLALIFFVWLKIKLKKSKRPVNGRKSAGIFGYSLMIFAAFSLFLALFFLITG